MNPKRRDLMFKLMDGESRVAHYLWHFDRFTRCDEMIQWLIQNRITGKEFLNWAKFHFGVSILDMATFILKAIERDKSQDHRPILLGRDMV